MHTPLQQGYAQLAEIVPTCKQSPSGGKLSRAAMLQKSEASPMHVTLHPLPSPPLPSPPPAIDYVVHQQTQALKQVEQVEKLEREVKALRIMSK